MSMSLQERAAFDQMSRMVYELTERVAKLEERKKPGPKPKDADADG